MRIGIDSQCVSYIVSAMNGILMPTDDLAVEKIALFRIYLYLLNAFYVTPTVMEECFRIRDKAKRDLHESYISALFVESYPDNRAAIEKLTKVYQKHHAKERDCKILAEAEVAGYNVLLTYDFNFLTKLSGCTSQVRLMKPSIFWNDLAVPRGTKPDKIPHPTNPMAAYNWWRW